MKRLYVSMMSFIVSLAMAFTPVFAQYDTSKIDQAVTKLKAYYTTNNTLSSADDIIAVESLGMQAESSTFKLADNLTSTLSATTTASSDGAIGKDIIAVKLLGKDPTNYNGVNLVSALENDVKSDGSFKKTSGVSNDCWAIFALYKIKSSKASTAAKYLASEISGDGSYGYSYNGTYYSDLSTTAWAIEALSLVGASTYKTQISKAFSYISSKYSKGAYVSYGSTGDPDTQACVLEAYFIADKTNYMKSTQAGDAIDYLINLQSTDGSFSAYDSAYATAEAARSLGTYKNGTVYSPTRVDTASSTASTSKSTSSTSTSAKATGYFVKYKTKVSYTGKAVKPVTKVSFDGKTLKLNTDYKITYSKNSKAIGSHTFTVKGLNEYKNLSIKKTFTVVPAKVTGVKVKAGVKKLTVSYKKGKGSVKYQVSVTYKKAKTIKTSKTKVTIKSLKKKKTYKVKVRAYKKVGKKTYYGSWSTTKSIKTK
jgi:hypothetical protein